MTEWVQVALAATAGLAVVWAVVWAVVLWRRLVFVEKRELATMLRNADMLARAQREAYDLRAAARARDAKDAAGE